MDFVSAVLKVVVIIQFTQSDEKSKGWMLSSESAPPRWRLPGFSASVHTNEPFEPLSPRIFLWFFGRFQPRLLSVAFWIWCSAWNLGTIRAIWDSILRRRNGSKQEMASSQAFELWSISSGFATRWPTRKKLETVREGRIETSHGVRKSIRSTPVETVRCRKYQNMIYASITYIWFPLT